MSDLVCLECEQSFPSAEFVRRHVRVHAMTYEAYALKHFYDGVRPLCACGCGSETAWSVALRDFAKYLRGHHMLGAKRSDETKRKIGATNSALMKQWMFDHPDEAQLRAKILRSGMTAAAEELRIASMKETYAQMSDADKEKFSEHSKNLWVNGRESMIRARARAAETFKHRVADGVYDFTPRNAKLSRRIAEMYVSGEFAWCRGHHDSPKTSQRHRFRSAWEKQYMQELDADDDVVQWRSEPMAIPYELSGKTRRYVPDFVVQRIERVELVEVKPTSLRDTETNAAKRAAALALCEREGWTYVEWSPSVSSREPDALPRAVCAIPMN